MNASRKSRTSVSMRFKKEIVGVIIDRFGKDIMILPSSIDGNAVNRKSVASVMLAPVCIYMEQKGDLGSFIENIANRKSTRKKI